MRLLFGGAAVTDDRDKSHRAPAHAEEMLFDRVAEILDAARTLVSRSVNTTMVQAYWLIGRNIVEVEQAYVPVNVRRFCSETRQLLRVDAGLSGVHLAIA